MSQITKLKVTSGPGSGTVTSVSGGNNITITGNPAVNPTVNVSGTTNHAVQVGNALGALTSIPVGLTGQVLTGVTGADPVFAAPAITGVTSITGNTGPAQTGAINLVTANSTPLFAGAAGTITLDFGLRNLFLGTKPAITTADENVVIGFNAGLSMTGAAIANVFLGFDCATSLVSGTFNVAIGDAAFASCISNCNQNTAIGDSALESLGNNQDNNTAIGCNSLKNLISGSDNSALGSDSGLSYNGAESFNIVIGNAGVNGESGVTRIGTNGNQTACFIAGIDGVNVGSVARVVTEASDQLGTATITAGTGISVSAGANTITISATGTTTLTVTTVNNAASPYTVLSTDEFLAVNTSGGAVTIRLPNAPATGRVYYIKDSNGTAAASNITVTTVGGAVNIDGATSFVMNTAYESISVIFDGSAYEVF